jgi:N-acyl-D-amino-acid deacylase
MRSSRALLVFALAVSLSALAACDRRPPAEPYDVLIAGGMLLDGSGTPAVRTDIGIKDGHVLRIAPELRPDSAARIVDATGLTIAPGFIDLHAHLEPLPDLPGSESAVRQGVTTSVGGPDGTSPWPLGQYITDREAQGVGMNVAHLVGHNTIRQQVMALDNRDPTADELERMKAMVAQAMDEGAFGISTGLRYLPGTFSKTEEVIALSQAAAAKGGIYTSHLRDEGLGLIEGVAEAIRIGREAKIPIVLTHHKVIGGPMWGSSVRTLAMIDSARAAGIDVMADQYPYTATYTGISVLVPAWALAGGDAEFVKRLGSKTLRDSIVAGIIWNIDNDRGGGDISRVQLARVDWDETLEGKTLKDWAAREGKEPTSLVGAELVIEAMKRGGAQAIYHVLADEDVERIMKYPFTMVASDGRLAKLGEDQPHPRWYGTFPRVLGHYVREAKVLTLEEAVRKMTSMPADRLGLTDRGRLVEGAWADVVVFDAATVIDKSTYEQPHAYPEGIPYVFVNGVPVVDGGKFTDQRPGKMLRHTAKAP